GADRQNIELTAFGCDIRGHALAQDILLERDPLDSDAGILGREVTREPLHPDHVAVVDGGDREGGLRECVAGDEQRDRADECARQRFHREPPNLLGVYSTLLGSRAYACPPDLSTPTRSSACATAKVPGALFHDLRRTFCYDAAEAGADYKTIMDYTRHKTPSTPLRCRILSPDGLEQAAGGQ